MSVTWEYVPRRYNMTYYELKGVPHFCGTVEDRGDHWLARRATYGPPGAPFAELDDAKAWVEDWARSHLEHAVRDGANRAAEAQRVLMEIAA